MNFEDYPQRIVKPLLELEQTNGLAAEHKLLLDLGETLLTHITGIIFGEYKRQWEIDEALEAEFYRNAKKKPSFGVFLNLLRKLIRANGQSVFDEFLDKRREYPAVSNFVFTYELLKTQVINTGKDTGLSDALEPLRKGRTVAKKSVLQFFEVFVAVRNTYAHPEEKARNPLRNWPLGDEYYDLINPLMRAALQELISAMHNILRRYRPVLVTELDDRQGRGSFLEEMGQKSKMLELDLNEEEIEYLSTDARYTLDEENRLTGKFYQAEIPQVNPSVAQRIIEQEKARMMEPVLLEMIAQKLDDGVLDELEYLVLKDTAFSSFIPEDHLRLLVEKVKTKKGIEGDVYVESKESNFRSMLNPYWLVYLSQLEDSTVEQSDDCLNTSNLHRNLWNQLTGYLQYLVESNLDNEYVQWKIKPNKYQIGRLTYTYWGQIYPDHSPFENGFSIGFIVAKKFSWVTAKKNNPLRLQLDQPCILLYTTLNNYSIEDIDFEGVAQKKYGRINYDLLMREREALGEMGGFTNALSYRTRDMHSFESYFREKEDCEEDENLWLYSKIWNAADFLDDGVFDPQRIYRIEKEIVTYLTLFSNSVLAINDWAISNGFNAEQVKEKRDKATRNQRTLISELEENLENPDFDIRQFAKDRGKELGLRADRVQKLLRKFKVAEETEND